MNEHTRPSFARAAATRLALSAFLVLTACALLGPSSASAQAIQQGPCGDKPCAAVPVNQGPCGPNPCVSAPVNQGPCGASSCATVPARLGPCGANPCPAVAAATQGPCGASPCPTVPVAQGPCGANPCPKPVELTPAGGAAITPATTTPPPSTVPAGAPPVADVATDTSTTLGSQDQAAAVQGGSNAGTSTGTLVALGLLTLASALGWVVYRRRERASPWS